MEHELAELRAQLQTRIACRDESELIKQSTMTKLADRKSEVYHEIRKREVTLMKMRDKMEQLHKHHHRSKDHQLRVLSDVHRKLRIINRLVRILLVIPMYGNQYVNSEIKRDLPTYHYPSAHLKEDTLYTLQESYA